MPVQDDDDSVPVRRYKKQKSRFPVWGWFVIGVAALMLLCGGAGIAGLVWYRGSSNAAPSSPKASSTSPIGKKVWKESELSKAVKGKSERQVIALLGEPDHRRMGDSSFDPVWCFSYYGIMQDGNGIIQEAKIWGDGTQASGRVR